jgi:hypothetical protein
MKTGHQRLHRTTTAGALVALLAGLILASTASAPPVGRAAPSPGHGDAQRPSVVQTTFKSVDAVLAGQWDFPVQTPAPLIVLIPSAGRIDRNGWYPGLGEDASRGIYAQLTRELVEKGFAVFRYDKPGAGRSGRGHYATDRSNAIEAFTRAVDHARVDTERVFLLGHARGTDAIAGIFPRYEAVTAPAGVILLDSVVGESDGLRINAPTLIVNPGRDPDNRYQYGEFVVDARDRAEKAELETELVIIDDGERGLVRPHEENGSTFYSWDPAVTKAILDWLMHRRGHEERVESPAPPRSTPPLESLELTVTHPRTPASVCTSC